MSWPFLYFPGDRLSAAELAGARLDGDVVEIGDAFMPADAVETRELRAASLRALLGDTLVATRATAAWVHGAVSAPPMRHTVQRRAATRRHHVRDARLEYRDHPVRVGLEPIAGVWVTTPAQTLADLVRAQHSGEDASDTIDALLAWRPDIAREAIAVLESGGAVHFKRAAAADLQARMLAAPGRAQEEVTR